ncbi:hypothetical protein E6U81_02530 [Streptomyces sp. A0592]|nr:hypothetical protein E6U81_02530 [Streptomyces sp. A0592]
MHPAHRGRRRLRRSRDQVLGPVPLLGFALALASIVAGQRPTPGRRVGRAEAGRRIARVSGRR